MTAARAVWYVAYGSNLSRSRFDRYVVGGDLVGARRRYPGCRDATPPSADQRVSVPHRLAFGRRSPTWGGGVAFVDPARDRRASTIGRAWRITAGQLGDVIAQENGRARLAADPTWFDLTPGAMAGTGFGWYGAVVRLDDLDGEPAFTVTSADWPVEPNPPTDPYLDRVREGLRELGLADAEIDAYLSSR